MGLRFLVELMRGVPVPVRGVLLRVDGVRDDGMRLEGLELEGLRLLMLGVVFRTPDAEGIRLVLELELAFVGMRRYMSRRDEPVDFEEPPTGFTV